MKRVRVGALVPWLPAGVLLLITIGAVAAPLLTPHDPTRGALADSLLPPSWADGGRPEYLLGTDGFGRDVLTRLLYGARVSLTVAALSLVIATAVGGTIGLIAGYAGGGLGSFLMRMTDMVISIPIILVALALSISLGPSLGNVVLVIGLLIWPQMARLIRAETMALRNQQFVSYSRAIGVGGPIVVARHIVPNVLPIMLVAATLEIASVILIEASLSFLGAGIPPPSASWGVGIADGRALIATGWWISLFPGLAILVTVMCTNALGNWMRDRTDPRRRPAA